MPNGIFKNFHRTPWDPLGDQLPVEGSPMQGSVPRGLPGPPWAIPLSKVSVSRGTQARGGVGRGERREGVHP